MVRLLLLLGGLWLLFMLVRKQLAAPKAETRPVREVRTVRCAHCGVHVPEPEAVRSQGHDYCSMEHRNLGPRRD